MSANRRSGDDQNGFRGVVFWPQSDPQQTIAPQGKSASPITRQDGVLGQAWQQLPATRNRESSSVTEQNWGLHELWRQPVKPQESHNYVHPLRRQLGEDLAALSAKEHFLAQDQQIAAAAPPYVRTNSGFKMQVSSPRRKTTANVSGASADVASAFDGARNALKANQMR